MQEGGIAQLLAMMAGGGGQGNSQFPLMPAGDVVPFPGKPGPFQGPTMDAQEFMYGRLNPRPKIDPQVRPISPDPSFWDGWAQRLRNRKLVDEMGGLRG